MAAPSLAEKPDDGAEELEEPGEPDEDPGGRSAEDQLEDLDVGGNAEPVNADSGEDPDVAEVELTEDDLTSGGSGLFSGDEDAGSSSSSSSSDDGDETTDDPLGLEDGGEMEGLAEAINEGAARLAVTGIDDDSTKDELEEEFTETFAAFRLGHFASHTADEYVFSGDEEVDPIWGLLGTAMLCAAFALWTRPDSEEQIERLRDAVSSLSNGVGGA